MNTLGRFFNRDGVLQHAVGAGASRLQDGRDRQRVDERRQAAVGLVAVAALEMAARSCTCQRIDIIGTTIVRVTAGAGWLRAQVGFAGAAYTLGGTGGGIAYDEAEFDEIARRGLFYSPTSEILIEESIVGWKWLPS